MSYSYNADGIRVSKNVNDIRHEYYLDGSRIIKETWADQTLEFLYDENNSVYCIVYTGGDGAGRYYLIKNLQGDVTRILNNNLETVAQYVYDPWGKLVSVLDADGEPNSGISIANINPIRYRGYYFDMETGFYYLNARYYDPALGRFISPDIPASLGADVQNLSQYNLYAYCFNNPINMSDETGTWPNWANLATKLAVGIGAIVVGAAAVAVTAATGGAAAAFVGAAVAGLKTAAVSGAIGAAVGAGTRAVSHRISTGSWSGAGEAVVDGAVDGFANGFMSGGIMAGGSQILSSGFKAAARAGVPTGRNGGLTIGNKVRVLSPNHPQAYEAGGTLLKIGSKYKNVRFDVGSNSLFHMNIQLAKTANYHLPIGMLGAGLWGGIECD